MQPRMVRSLLKAFETGIYTPYFSCKTYNILIAEKRSILGGKLTARQLAAETDTDFQVIECALDENTTYERRKERSRKVSVSDGRWEIYEPVVEIITPNHVIINNSKPLRSSVKQVLRLIDKTQTE